MYTHICIYICVYTYANIYIYIYIYIYIRKALHERQPLVLQRLGDGSPASLLVLVDNVIVNNSIYS